MGYTESFTNKMKKSQLIELVNKLHDENCELKSDLSNTTSSRNIYCKWNADKNETIDDLKRQNEELKKQMDKQHEEIQEIKKKLKDIIS